MRNRLAVLVPLALAVNTITAEAQVGGGAGTTLGPLVGVNSTRIVGDSVEGENLNSRTGFVAGLQLQHSFRGGLFLRSGLLYSMRGASNAEGGTSVVFRLDYLEVPLLLGYTVPGAGQVRPFLMAGAQLGVKAKCEAEGTSGTVTVTVDCDDPDLEADVSGTDLAFVAGAGIAFSVGRGTLSVDARYAVGTKDIAKDTAARNRGFTVAASYMFRIGGN